MGEPRAQTRGSDASGRGRLFYARLRRDQVRQAISHDASFQVIRRLEDGAIVALDVKVGDRILFGKYSGSETIFAGTEYLIMREDDVLGILDATAQTSKKAA
jgi:hypothetical protein